MSRLLLIGNKMESLSSLSSRTISARDTCIALVFTPTEKEVMLEILRSIVNIEFYETADCGGGLVVFGYWFVIPLKSGLGKFTSKLPISQFWGTMTPSRIIGRQDCFPSCRRYGNMRGSWSNNLQGQLVAALCFGLTA